MASKASKWMAAVASAALSVMMGGAAFAAPGSAFEETGSAMGLLPGPISEAVPDGRTNVAEAQRQVREARSNEGDADVISQIHGVRTNVAEAQRQVRELRSPAGASDVISKALSKVASNVGTTVAKVKGQAREVLSQAS